MESEPTKLWTRQQAITLALAVTGLALGLGALLWLIVVTQATSEFEGDVAVHGRLSAGVVRQLSSEEPLPPGTSVMVGADGVTLEARQVKRASPTIYVMAGSAEDTAQANGSSLAPFTTIGAALAHLNTGVDWEGQATILVRGVTLEVPAGARWRVRGRVVIASEKRHVPIAELQKGAALQRSPDPAGLFRVEGSGDSLDVSLLVASFLGERDMPVPFLRREGDALLLASTSPPQGTAAGSLLIPTVQIQLAGTLQVGCGRPQDELILRGLGISGGASSMLETTGEGSLALGAGCSVVGLRALVAGAARFSANQCSLLSLGGLVIHGALQAELRGCSLAGVDLRVGGGAHVRVASCVVGEERGETSVEAEGAGTRLEMVRCDVLVRQGKPDLTARAGADLRLHACKVMSAQRSWVVRADTGADVRLSDVSFEGPAAPKGQLCRVTRGARLLASGTSGPGAVGEGRCEGIGSVVQFLLD